MSDDTVSRAVQEVWDALYSRAQGNYHTATNELYKAIFGHQPMLFQWVPEENRFKLSNPHILNVWIDPTAETVDDADYVILDTFISADKAKSLWPHLEDTIDQAKEKNILDIRKDKFRTGSPFRIEFKRDMLIVRTVWMRHQKVPMTLEEALESGAVRVEAEDGEKLTGDRAAL